MSTTNLSERRSFNTEIRAPWNPVIHNLLKAIEYHVHYDLEKDSEYHRQQAAVLRKYVANLKDWIEKEEDLERVKSVKE